MRRVFAVLGILFVIALFFGLQVASMRNPEANARLMNDIRNSPPQIFYPVAVTLLLVGGVMPIGLMLYHKRWSRIMERSSVLAAKRIALSRWRVVGDAQGVNDYVGVRFRHMSWGRWTFILAVRPGHPDVELFRGLRKGDIVEFEPLSQGMECALEHELCGFLRIKSIK